jgi:hypothetical protein
MHQFTIEPIASLHIGLQRALPTEVAVDGDFTGVDSVIA